MKKAVLFSVVIPCFFLGAFLWSNVLGFYDDILRLYGFIICLIGLFGLIGIGTVYEDKTIWGVLNALVLSLSLFAAFGFFGVVPYLSQFPMFRNVCQIIALPLLLGGGASTGLEIYVVVIL